MGDMPASRGANTTPDQCMGALRMLCDVASLCNAPSSVARVGSAVLRRVCDFNGWYAGRLHVAEPATPTSRLTVGMRLTAAEVTEAATAVTRAALDELDALLLAEVAASGTPVWQRTEFPAGGGVAITGMCAPIATNGTMLGAITLLSQTRPPPADEIRWAVETVATHLAGVIERRMLDRTIAEASSAEQGRIGRELHDLVGQQLSGAALMGDAIARRLEITGVPEAKKEAEPLRLVTTNVRNALEAVRDITEGLMPLDLGEGGLAAALGRMAHVMNERSDVAVRVVGTPPEMPDELSRELLLVATEAVRNAVAHSGASTVDIRWARDEGAGQSVVVLEITDDGAGMPEGASYRTGRGLAIMRHRVNVIDGVFEFVRRPEGGTTVRCTVPIGPGGGREDAS